MRKITLFLALLLSFVGISTAQAGNGDSLVIASAKENAGNRIPADPDGTFPITFEVVVYNAGTTTLTPENATVSIKRDIQHTDTYPYTYSVDDDSIVGTFPIERTLVPIKNNGGFWKDSINYENCDTFNITVHLDAEKFAAVNRYYVVENVSGRSSLEEPSQYSYSDWPGSDYYFISPVPYKIDFRITQDKYNYTGSLRDNVQDLGLLQKATTKWYRIYNDGGKPAYVTKVTATPGYTVNLETPDTVKYGEYKRFSVDIDPTVDGVESGIITIGGEDFADSLKFKVAKPDPTRWTEDFENNGTSLPAGFIAEDPSYIAISDYPEKKLDLTDNKYCVKITSSYSASDESRAKLILPKLKAKEGGETLYFDGGKTSSYGPTLTVWYSTDRQSWTALKTFGRDDFSDDTQGYEEGYVLTSHSVDVPEGEGYVAFSGNYINIDNLYGLELVPIDYDLMFTGSKFPKKGTVNNALTVTATLKNVNTAVAKDGTVTFHFGSETLVQKFDSIAAGKDSTFTFTITPHEADSVKAYVEAAIGENYTLSTPESVIAIDPESANKVITAGVYTGNPDSSYSDDFEYYTPFRASYKFSQSSTLYTPEQLQGLNNGDKITKFAYPYYSTAYGDVTADSLIFYIENTDATEATATDVQDLIASGATPVFEQTGYVFPAGGSASEPQEFSIDLDKPFVYTGKSIRIVAVALFNETTYGLKFKTDKTTKGLSAVAANDYSRPSTENTSGYGVYYPITEFTVLGEPVEFTGTVKDSLGNPVEGAVVTLKNDSADVVYTAVTDAAGNYTLNVIQTSLPFSVSYAAPGFGIFTLPNVDINATQDVVLPSTSTGISEIKSDIKHATNGNVYNLNGQKVSNSLVGLPKGVYIIDNKKVLIK